MIKYKKIQQIITLIFLITFVNCSVAQPGASVSSTNKKAIKLYQEGINY